MNPITNVQQTLHEDYVGFLDPAANGPSAWYDNYDQEFETPDVQDDAMLRAETQSLEEKIVDVSPEQNIEQAIYQYEKTFARMEDQRWHGQARWMGRLNEEARLTRIMFCREFVKALNHEGATLLLNDYSIKGRVGINAWVPTMRGGKWKYITTVQAPFAPEYSIMRFNEYLVPTNEKYRGWRTTLLILIMEEVITEEQALEAFGAATGPASGFYREQLWKWRNRRER